MAVTTHVDVKNGRLNAISTAWAAGGALTLRLYDGTPPANVGAALSGNNLLAQVTPVPAAASGGTKDMLGGAKTTTGAIAGTASFYRAYGGTTAYEQGTVGLSGASPDLVIDNTSIAVGQTVNFNTFVKTEP